MTVGMNLQDETVRQLLTTVHCLVLTVTMEAVWIVLAPSPVSVIQDSLENSVMLKSMNVKRLDVRMDHVKI